MAQIAKKRIDELDMVKGFAIILVFFRHINEITGISNLDNPFTITFKVFFEIVMILFFLCSGYVFSNKGTILQGIGKKAKQLLIPLLTFGLFDTAIYFVRYIIVEGKPFIWFLDNTLTNFVGLLNWNIRLGAVIPNPMKYAFVPYWFIFQLFVAFCLFIPLMKWLEEKHIAIKIAVAAVLMGIAMVLNYFDVQHTLADTFNSSVPYAFVLINLFGFTSILLIGRIFKEISFFDLKALPKAFSSIIAIGCLIIYYLLPYDPQCGYALQYGKWGPFDTYGFIIITIGGITLTYFLIFVMGLLKRFSPVKKAFCFLGENSLYILMLHMALAETICWIGGFWHDVYHEPFDPANISIPHYFITVLGTIAGLAIFFIGRYFFQNRKRRMNKT